MTSEERRVLADLEDRTRQVDPQLARSLRGGTPRLRARLRSRRVGGVAAALVLSVGIAMMLATFTRWPIVAVVGVVLQVVALKLVLARWAPWVGATFRRWTQD